MRSSTDTGPAPRAARRAIVAIVALLATLALAAPAKAGTGETWLPVFSFDGSDTTAGKFSSGSIGIGNIAIDQTSGTVYVVDYFPKGVIDRFNLAGEAQPFPATGESSLDPYPLENGFKGNHDIAVDSYSPNQGRIYLSSGSESGVMDAKPIKAFKPSGELLWELDVEPTAEGVTTDLQGRLWVSINLGIDSRTDVFAASGSPPAKVGFVPDAHSRIACDASGNFYTAATNGGLLRKYEDTCASLEPDLEPTIPSNGLVDLAVDQSSPDGHIFALRHPGSGSGFTELSAEGEVIGTFGTEAIANGQGIAYDTQLNRVYVTDNGGEGGDDSRVVVFEKGLVTTPDVTLDPASEYGGSTAKFSGTVNPLGVESSYHFEWKKASEPWSAASSSPEQVLPKDEEDHAVSFEATGLAPNTVFDVRLVAENTELELKEISAERSFSNIAVEVETIPAAPRTDTTARLNARVSPAANPATVSFELSEDGGESWQVLPDHQIAEGVTGKVVVGEDLTGLTPDTTYLYRALAENPIGGASPQGEELSFTTRTTAEMVLSERGIELVNSPDKGNQGAGGQGITADGQKVLWGVGGGSPGGNSGGGDAFVAKRTAQGWKSQTLIPPAAEQLENALQPYQQRARNSDLSHFVFEVPREVEGPHFAHLDDQQGQELLKSYDKAPANANSIRVAISEDGTQVLSLSWETEQLEEIGNGTPEIVSLMPDETESACGLKGEGADSGFLGALLREGYRMLSADASRVYFQTEPNGKCSGAKGIYVRDRDAEVTTLIAPGSGANDALFIRTSDDGKTAFFLTHGKLDPADTNATADVYRWEEEAEASTCLTCVVPNAAVEPEDVLVSEDLSHVYFESKGQLIASEGEAGKRNLYVLSDEEVRFIATTGTNAALGGQVQLSADGEALAFKAQPDLSMTADQIAPQCPSPVGGKGCPQLYRYEDADRSLTCISCDPHGETTNAVGLESGFAMSADGSTLGFATEEPLVALDVNKGADLYEWRGGSHGLITDGITSYQKGFSGAPRVSALDEDGTSILFMVAQPGLTGFEQDLLLNLYVARIGGGFELPSPPAPCEGDSCQGPLLAPPPKPGVASEGFNGRGNVPPQSRKRRPCAKKRGKAKRRCIRKHKRRAQRARAKSETGRAR